MSQSQRTAIDELLRHAPFDIGGDVIEQRPIVEKLMTSVPIPSDITTGSRQLGGVPVVDVSTPDSDPAHVVFYLHGGAYAFGSAATSVGLAGDVARRAKARAISVDYRLAPEHPFPAALDDAVAAYSALIAEGVPADQIAVAGESSGGGLLAATLVALKEAGLPQPSSATIFSPWADLSVSGATMTTKAGVDAALTPAALRTRAADYLAGTAPNAPLASPIFADLTGLAPLLIQAGSYEILLDDAVRLAARAAQHDVPVELQVWPAVPHVFQGFAAMLDEGGEALDAAGSFIRRHW